MLSIGCHVLLHIRYQKGHIVKWFTDNQNVTLIVQVGSRKQHLQDGAMAILYRFVSKMELL